MAVEKIIGAACLVDENGAVTGVAEGGNEGPLVALGAAELSTTASLPADVVAWVGPGDGGRVGTARRFRSDVDLQPYFQPGDPIEIDLYQGMIRHLAQGYAFPVTEMA